MSSGADDVLGEARRLRQEWDRFGRSPGKDFYVASHPGWQDLARRDAQARIDANFVLHGLDANLESIDVLEIGCGLGRLAAHIAPRVPSYTGLDIAPSMVTEARARHGALRGARFLECDGLSLPPAALDRRYGLIFAHAVFIHCPRGVIAAWLGSAQDALAPGGELRFQLRADVNDPGGLTRPERVAGANPAPAPAPPDLPADAPLAEPPDYMGPAFGWHEAHAFVRELARGPHELHRSGPFDLYARIVRPA
jgi:SAM-dependent methyltransferase